MDRPQKELADVLEISVKQGWLLDNELCCNGWRVGTAVQPPTECQLPPFDEHLLVLTTSFSQHHSGRFSGQEINVSGCQDHFLILPHGTPSEFSWCQDDETIFFSFSQGLLCDIAQQIDYSNPRIELKPLVFGTDDQITRLAHCLRQEIQGVGGGSRLFNESLLIGVGIYLLRQYCVVDNKIEMHEGGLSPYNLRQVIDYINSNLIDNDVSLKSLSKITGLSQCYFARQFKKSMGITPHQYVIQQRLEMAKRLLKCKDISISKIAFDCGFSSQPHFYGAFRKATGSTPKRYRDEI